MKKNVRIGVGVLIVLLTIAEFAYYLSKHTYLIKHLAHTPPLTIVWILLLYIAILGALVLILEASLRICRVAMGPRDNILLNTYSLFINFFVIGQAGPGIRAAYLKKYYGLLVRKFLFVSLLYYACYAIVSALLMLAGSPVPWYFTILAALLFVGISFGAFSFYMRHRKLKNEKFNLSLSNLSYLMLATILQAILQVSIYFIELHSVNGHITLKQTLAYTGVANFALFVGLTPGAIGIRESFLIFSEKLHHISSANIIAANIIDRSVYLVFLGILCVFIVSAHIQRRFTDTDKEI